MGTLTEECGKFFEKFYDFGDRDKDCLVRVLNKFCKSGKKDDAFSVYFCFCEIYRVLGTGYDGTKKLLELLADHEYHSGGLLNKHRDHYSHSVYVFALGLAVYAAYEDVRKACGNAAEFLHLWGMTALFHDIGYPFQLAHEQIKRYTSDLWGENVRDNPHVAYVNTDKLLSLGEGLRVAGEENSVFEDVNDLLAYGVCRRMGYDRRAVRDILAGKVSTARFMDHGYFGAVVLLKEICGQNAEISSGMLDALSAILMHNSFNKYDMPDAVKVSTQNHPYAYLLMLCDDLQNWDRQAFGYTSKKDPLPWDIGLSAKPDALTVTYIFDSYLIDIPGKAEPKENRNVKKLRPAGDAPSEFASEIARYIDTHVAVRSAVAEKKNDKLLHKYTSADNFVNLCDFAKAVHRCYQEECGGASFDELSLEFKLSNIEQAKSYAYKLELINCFYSDRELDYPALKEFTSGTEEEELSEKKDDLGFLAREEHLRWVNEKLEAGWHYGTSYIDPVTQEENRVLRNELKEHRDLIPYDELSLRERKKDELMIRNMIPFLYEQGHCIRIYRYRHGRKPDLEIVGIGHRTITGDTERYKERIKGVLKRYQRDYRVVVRSGFAYGADMLIAECAAELGITMKATLPVGYVQHIESMKRNALRNQITFDKAEELALRHLLARAVVLKSFVNESDFWTDSDRYMAARCSKVIALWDGDESAADRGCAGRTLRFIRSVRKRGLKDGTDIHVIECSRRVPTDDDYSESN